MQDQEEYHKSYFKEEADKASTKDYAKRLAILATLTFWIICITIGITVILEKNDLAITLLLWFGTLAPTAIWYLLCLIREKHSGACQPRRLSTPLKWGAAFFLVNCALLYSAEIYREQELDRKLNAHFGNKNPKLKAIYKKYGLEPTTSKKLPAKNLKPDIDKIDEELRRRGVIE